MSKNSVSEWSTVSSGNGDIAGLTLGLDMPPSYVNNAMQEMMAQIKQWKDGYIDPLTGLPVYQSLQVENIDIEGIANFKGSLTLNGTQGNLGQVLVSQGSSETPVWGNAFVRGMIMLWSGTTATIPSGWALCNGTNGTPQLTNRFIVGAGGSLYSPNATGGYKDATLVSHSHTVSGTASASSVTGTASASSVSGTNSGAGTHNHSGSTSTTGHHSHTLPHYLVQAVAGTGDIDRDNEYQQWKALSGQSTSATGNHAHTFTTSTIGNHTHTWSGTASASSVTGTAKASSVSGTAVATGSSATDKNLPPYYALAYIMKL